MCTVHTYAAFDGYEIHPVLETVIAGEPYTICEPFPSLADATAALSDAQAAGFEAHLLWTVYGHLPTGGVEAINDLNTEAEAHSFLAQLGPGAILRVPTCHDPLPPPEAVRAYVA